MSPIAKGVLALALATCAVGQVEAPTLQQLSEGFREPGEKAFDSIKFAWTLEKERWLINDTDAKKALDAARRKKKTPEDQYAYDLLKATLTFVEMSHVEAESHGVVAMSNSPSDRGWTHCLGESYAIFDPEDMKKTQKEAAKEGLCLTEYKKMMDELAK